jgi:hypothetical protein
VVRHDIDTTLRQYGFRQRVCGDRPRDPLYFPQAVCIC